MKKRMPRTKLDWFFWITFIFGSIALLLGSYLHKIPIALTEDWGFITGALTVWWTVKEDVWNWPVGIINDIFFIILFWRAGLFADTLLQVVYIILAVWGWYWWLKGGKNKSELKISKVSPKEITWLTLLGIISTILMTKYLGTIGDSAPLWDAMTTVLSLVATYMLTLKQVENWYVWITADVIYIWLYASQNLFLISVLYIIFLLMCLQGLKEWRATLAKIQK
jgi:nicotinamide mononucleotide transporter